MLSIFLPTGYIAPKKSYISGILLPFFSISSLASLQEVTRFFFQMMLCCSIYFLFCFVFILLCGPNKVIWETTVLPFILIAFSSCLSLGSNKLILSVDFMHLWNPCSSSVYRFLRENVNQIFQRAIIALKISQILYQLDCNKEGFLKYWMISSKEAQHLKFYILYIWLWKAEDKKKKRYFQFKSGFSVNLYLKNSFDHGKQTYCAIKAYIASSSDIINCWKGIEKKKLKVTFNNIKKLSDSVKYLLFPLRATLLLTLA